jgi:hypothetical protein
MNVLATIGQWCTERSLESKHGSTSRSISSSSYRLESTPKRTGGVDFLMNVLATIGQWCTERSLESKHGSTSRSISSSSYRLESTLKRIARVDFLMNVLATMGQLCTERSLESKNWSKFWVFTKGDEASSSDYVGRVKAVIFWQVKINCF